MQRLAGNWYDSTKSKQGFVFQGNPVANALFVAWYAHAPNGQSQGASGQRWYTGLADYARGTRSIPFALRETTGGLIDQSPKSPATAQVGTGTLTFTNRSAATLSFAFASDSNAGQAGGIALSRVGPAPTSCAF